MGKILVSGLVNMETTVKISSFPIEYSPIFYPNFGVNSYPGGVGFNLSLALNKLGNEVKLLTLTGEDAPSFIIKNELEKQGVNTQYIAKTLSDTCQSVILYDEQGKRQIYCDLKDIQEHQYDEDVFKKAVEDCDMVCLCNINFSRRLLSLSKELGKIIATDVHVLEDIYDTYNADFMRYADILFLSNERIDGAEEDFVRKIAAEYDNQIIVVGLGAEGALLYVKEDQFMGRFPAVFTRNVVNTIGAGDALYAAFVHFYNQQETPYDALRKAIVFASYKIGEKGAAQGFLTEQELEALYLR